MTAPVLPALQISGPRPEGPERAPDADTGFEDVLQQQVARRSDRSRDNRNDRDDRGDLVDRRSSERREPDSRIDRRERLDDREADDRLERDHSSLGRDDMVHADRPVREDPPGPGPDRAGAGRDPIVNQAAATTATAAPADNKSSEQVSGDQTSGAATSTGGAVEPVSLTATPGSGTVASATASTVAETQTPASVSPLAASSAGRTAIDGVGSAELAELVGETAGTEQHVEQLVDPLAADSALAVAVVDGAAVDGFEAAGLIGDGDVAASDADGDAPGLAVDAQPDVVADDGDTAGSDTAGAEDGSQNTDSADAQETAAPAATADTSTAETAAPSGSSRPVPDGVDVARLPGGAAFGRLAGDRAPTGGASTGPVAATSGTTGTASVGPAAASTSAATAGAGSSPTGPTPSPTAADAGSTTGVGPLAGNGDVAAATSTGSQRSAAPTATPAAARIAEIAEQLENRPPPRAVTVELAELDGARVRIAVQAGGVKVTVLDGTMDSGARAALDRELENALGAKGFDLAGRGGDQGRSRQNRGENPENSLSWSPPWTAPASTNRPNRAEEGVRL